MTATLVNRHQTLTEWNSLASELTAPVPEAPTNTAPLPQAENNQQEIQAAIGSQEALRQANIMAEEADKAAAAAESDLKKTTWEEEQAARKHGEADAEATQMGVDAVAGGGATALVAQELFEALFSNKPKAGKDKDGKGKSETKSSSTSSGKDDDKGSGKKNLRAVGTGYVAYLGTKDTSGKVLASKPETAKQIAAKKKQESAFKGLNPGQMAKERGRFNAQKQEDLLRSQLCKVTDKQALMREASGHALEAERMLKMQQEAARHRHVTGTANDPKRSPYYIDPSNAMNPNSPFMAPSERKKEDEEKQSGFF